MLQHADDIRTEPSSQLRLHDGRLVDLATMSRDELRRLHWEEERAYARRILASEKTSQERSAVTREGYAAITRIIDQTHVVEGRSSASCGYGAKHAYILERVIRKLQREKNDSPRFFELGFGRGQALELAASQGCKVLGLEINQSSIESVARRLPAESIEQFFAGDFLGQDFSHLEGRVDLVYWNDVLEHVPPDELPDYLEQIRRLLRPGGAMLTLTPNWHVRPSDITNQFRPPRSQAEGFHLREYSVRELYSLFRAAGFSRVATPIVATRHKAFFLGSGAIGLKRALEPALELLPFRACRLVASVCSLSATLATR